MDILKNKALFTSLALGAETVTFSEEGAYLERFIPAEKECCAANGRHPVRVGATAGMRLSFVTDSPRLTLGVSICNETELKDCAAIDVKVNGKYIDSIANFTEDGRGIFPDGTVAAVAERCYPHGSYNKEFSLGEGEKTVSIYLAYPSRALITELSLEDGALLRPNRPKLRHLIYGDSITHGYNATHPSRTYIALLDDFLDAESFHKGVDGGTYFAPLAAAAPQREYDLVTVAYGTNDWDRVPFDAFAKESSEFLSTLASRYPTAKIYVLTPTWRADGAPKQKPKGAMSDYRDHLAAECEKHPNMRVIHCVDFIPHDPAMFEDKRLHPNDEGFSHYAKGLIEAIGPDFKA
ncbi:MAG: SGNH/GDSL hydrolase family protein [Clostridia bacterium]|nr:SGNH/GDSL hydrolase family protein [Clostridia bacterium]